MPIKNYSTSVSEDKTVSEIQTCLSRKGALEVLVQYDSGRPAAVFFRYKVGDNIVPFRLPCNFDGVFKAMCKGYKDGRLRNRFERDPKSREQARRVAWRILKDWVEAQMAIVEAEQAQLAEVFLPYAVYQDGKTMFERFAESNLKALPAASEGADARANQN
jgi:hypothetical protein